MKIATWTIQQLNLQQINYVFLVPGGEIGLLAGELGAQRDYLMPIRLPCKHKNLL